MSSLRMGVPRGPPESGREESSETPRAFPRTHPVLAPAPGRLRETPEAEPGLRGAS